MRDEVHGAILAIGSGITGAGAWFLAHIQVIDGLMDFAILCLSGIGAIVGLRKVLRK